MPRTELIPAFCAQCRSRCGCKAEVEDGRLVAVHPWPEHPSGEQLCPKGLASAELIYHPDRVLRPLRRTNPKGAADPGWEPISWEEALDTVAEKLAGVARANGPQATAFGITTGSGTHISDSVMWIARFVHAYGSPNTVYSTELCNWHKDHASRFTFGYDLGIPDYQRTDCVLLWGNNPTNTWLARSVEIGKARKRGAKMLVVDPRRTALARRADVWLQVNAGTDQVLALGLARGLIERGAHDEAFLARWSNGPALVREDNGRLLRASDVEPGGSPDRLVGLGPDGTLLHYDPGTRSWDGAATARLDAACEVDIDGAKVRCRSAFSLYRELVSHATPERVAAVTGVEVAQQAAAVDLLASVRNVAYYAWNGVGQSTNATQTDRALSLLYSLKGCYGQAGANVPGAAAPFGDLSGWDLVKPEHAEKALGLAERPLGPPAMGWITASDLYEAVLEEEPYAVKALVSFGSNLLTSQPDTDKAIAALKALDFYVHADFFVNATAHYADIVLPVATSWEREALRTGFDVSLRGQRYVQLRPAVVAPQGEARSDVDIVMGLAERLGLGGDFYGLDTDLGYDEMLAPAGLDTATLRARPEGMEVAGEVKLRPFALADSDGRVAGFPTPSGLVEIYSEQLLLHGQLPLPDPAKEVMDTCTSQLPLRLGSGKSLVYCHSQHRNLPSLRRLMPDPPLEIAAADAAPRGIEDGDWVRVVTATGEAVARAKVSRNVRAGSVFALHGWWGPGSPDAPYGEDEPLAANLNQLISSEQRDPVSGSLPLRATACEITKLEGAGSQDGD